VQLAVVVRPWQSRSQDLISCTARFIRFNSVISLSLVVIAPYFTKKWSSWKQPELAVIAGRPFMTSIEIKTWIFDLSPPLIFIIATYMECTFQQFAIWSNTPVPHHRAWCIAIAVYEKVIFLPFFCHFPAAFQLSSRFKAKQIKWSPERGSSSLFYMKSVICDLLIKISRISGCCRYCTVQIMDTGHWPSISPWFLGHSMDIWCVTSCLLSTVHIWNVVMGLIVCCFIV
jgi:hypothetical protein